MKEYFRTWGFVLAADMESLPINGYLKIDLGTEQIILSRRYVWYPKLGIVIVAFVPVGIDTFEERIVYCWTRAAANDRRVLAAMEP